MRQDMHIEGVYIHKSDIQVDIEHQILGISTAGACGFDRHKQK